MKNTIEKISCIADLNSFRILITQYGNCEELKSTFKLQIDGSVKMIKKNTLGVINPFSTSDEFVIFVTYCHHKDRDIMIDKIKAVTVDFIAEKQKNYNTLAAVVNGAYSLKIKDVDF